MDMQAYDAKVAAFKRGQKGLPPEIREPSTEEKYGRDTFVVSAGTRPNTEMAFTWTLLASAAIALVTISALWVAIGSVAIIAGIGFFFIAWLLVSNIVNALYYQRHFEADKRRSLHFLTETIGHKPEMVDFFTYHGQYKGGLLLPYALAFDAGKIYIIDRGILKIIGLNELVGLEVRHKGHIIYKPLIWNDLAGKLEAQDATDESLYKTTLENGVFLEVDDDRKDLWQFMSSDRDLLEKWGRKIERELKRARGEI